MSRLTPTPVVDKNGKLTTVHKKASGAPTASKLGSLAPTLGGAAGKPSAVREFKPTAMQKALFNSGYPVYAKDIDPALYPLLVHGHLTSHLNIKVSDVTLYEALGSFKDTTNALACLTVREGSLPDTAFLEEHGLSHLVNTDESRKETMRSALERRIPAKEFIAFERTYGTHKDLPTYLDIAQTYSIASFNKVTGLIDEVRRGSIHFSDLMTVGPKPINSMRRFGADILGLMKGLADGSADYTAEQLKSIFNKCNQYSEVTVMATLLQKYGGEYAASIKDPMLAHEICLHCDGDEQEYKPALDYAIKFRELAFRNQKQMYELFRAGVDVDFAVEQSKAFDKVSVRQIIALHEGTPKPITSGWL